MDLDQVWKDAIANVISKFTDLKDMSVVKCIETMCSFEVSGNNMFLFAITTWLQKCYQCTFLSCSLKSQILWGYLTMDYRW